MLRDSNSVFPISKNTKSFGYFQRNNFNILKTYEGMDEGIWVIAVYFVLRSLTHYFYTFWFFMTCIIALIFLLIIKSSYVLSLINQDIPAEQLNKSNDSVIILIFLSNSIS